MRKYLFFVVILLSVFTMNAQFSVHSEQVGAISDGDVLEFGSVAEDSDANFSYEVFNDSDEPINMRIKMVSFENTDGSLFEICFGMCYYSVHEGLTYPLDSSTEGYVTIQPGQSQPAAGDHFWNKDDQGLDPNEDIVYVFQFQQVDESGNFVQESLEFSYVYSKTLDVDKVSNPFGVKIISTVINNGKINIQADQTANVEVYNLLGQKMLTSELKSGLNTLDISNFSSQIYLVRVRNAQGELQTYKIVVQ